MDSNTRYLLDSEKQDNKIVESAIAILQNCNSIFEPFLGPLFWALFGPNDCLHTYTILCVDLNCAATLQ